MSTYTKCDICGYTQADAEESDDGDYFVSVYRYHQMEPSLDGHICNECFPDDLLDQIPTYE